MIFVDTNILIDIATGDPRWADSAAQASRMDRRATGALTAALPAFVVGSHASLTAATLLTRNARSGELM